jgi:hypothetical protein
MPTRAHRFFTSIVEPTVVEFLNDPYDIRRGMLAAIVLNHMADYWCWHLHNSGKHEFLEKVRSGLINQCPDFAIIRDIADASKHSQLTRLSAQLSSSGQITRPRSPGLFEAPFGEGTFAEASRVTYTLDIGTTGVLEMTIRSVLEMWQMLLSKP